MPQTNAHADLSFIVPRQWIGHSGRSYNVVPEDLSRFSLESDALYVIATGARVLWAGSQADLIADSASRARFKMAIREGSFALRLIDSVAPEKRFFLIIDIENGAPAMSPLYERAG